MLLFALHSIIPSESAENLSKTFVPFSQRKVILEFLCQKNLEDLIVVWKLNFDVAFQKL